ncbi:MAG: DUF983 domain-containing protein [Candidatus Pacebacteria bacterium]|nr:DUF983 domain-containing protein [Candidatus Paceibacterota bacterium]
MTQYPLPTGLQATTTVWQKLWRGLQRHCPNCGQGKLFKGYLKVEPICAVCGQDNGQFPSDDAAPYFTILLVGHLVAPFAITMAVKWPTVSLWWQLGIFLPVTLGLTLGLLPLIKGGVIAVASHFKVIRR